MPQLKEVSKSYKTTTRKYQNPIYEIKNKPILLSWRFSGNSKFYALKFLARTNSALKTRPQTLNFDVALFLSLYYSGIRVFPYNEYKLFMQFSFILGIRKDSFS